MAETDTCPPAEVERLKVWYHFPISLLEPVDPEKMTGWEVKARHRRTTNPSQFTYFHPFISDALFDGSPTAAFQVLRRNCAGAGWQAEFREQADVETLGFKYRRFEIALEEVELWVARPNSDLRDRTTCRESPGLAILAVAVEFTGVAEGTLTEIHDPSAQAKVQFRKLTLHDAMDALEWVRRVSPRWRLPNGLPGDSLSQVITPDGELWPSHSREDDVAAFRADKGVKLFPWVERLLAPMRVDGKSAEILGDERAFMSSAIALKTPEGLDDRATIRAVPDGSLFRLAEADRAFGGGYAYNSAFLETLRERYFYTRHAPDKTEGREDVGNATIILMSQHHLCALGAGDFAQGPLIDYMESYYRHMQFLCVFEYFRLIQFSRRLTRLVADKKRDSEAFRKGVLDIRGDFLTHTHLHHFTNVSSQLQAKELFDRLYSVTGIPEMFAEVERELQSAADYAALLDARDQSQRAEELNNLVAVGVPASLALTLAGFGWLTGEKGPDLPYFSIPGSPFTAGLVQLSALLTLTLILWAMVKLVLKLKKMRRIGLLEIGFAMAILTLVLAAIHSLMVGVAGRDS